MTTSVMGSEPSTHPPLVTELACKLLFSIEIQSKQEAVSGCLDEIDQRLIDAGLNDHARGNVQVVLAEVLNNVVEHAYEYRTNGTINIEIKLTSEDIIFCVLDSGREMPDLQMPNGQLPSHDVPLEDLPEGGFGWFLIRQMTQGLTYTRVQHHNRLDFLVKI